MTTSAPPTHDGSLAPGTRVDGWIVGSPIGAGAMGAVYEATDVALGRKVALKVLRRAYADDPAAIARFEREARAASRVEHPGIVDVIAIGALDDGRPYLVMSMLRGRSLRAELRARGALPLADAWALVRQVALAVAAAHEAGVVHRDLKPDNVFLERADDAPPRPRVLDFGLARLLPTADGPPDGGKLTQTGVPMGTPPYMAPEQWWGTDVGPAADQYALGVLLYELVTGHPPFVSDKLVEIAQKHLHEPPPRMANAPEAVEALVARTLSKRPEARFPTLRDLVVAGDAAVGSDFRVTPIAEPARGTGTLSGTDFPASVAQVLTAKEPETRPEPAARPQVRPVLAALGIGLAALWVVGYSGSARWDPALWMRIAGYASFVSLTAALVAAAVVLRRAWKGGEPPPGAGALLACLLPAIVGTVGTYTGWQKVRAGVLTWPETERLTIFDVGLWEAGCSRFIGFALSAIVLAALAVVSGPRTGAPILSRRESLAMAAGAAALAGAATVAGASSAAWLGALSIVLLAGLTTGAPSAAGANETVRAIAAGLSAVLGAMVGLARVEGRAAILWDEAPTRAARVAEIVATDAEREVTVPVVAVLVILVLIAVSLRLLRLRQRSVAVRPAPATVALVVLVLAGLATDAFLHARVAETRRELRAALSHQFVLFGKLDPPASRALSPELFAPHRAPALQLTRATVAIDGEPAAPVRALDSETGTLALVGEIGQALARRPEGAPEDAPDLSIAVDRRVPWSTLSRVLSAAHAAGTRRIEVLLTRGVSPRIPPSAPPEASHVLPRDFVAVPAELVRDGDALPEPSSEALFSTIAADWAHRARAGGPLHIRARARSSAQSAPPQEAMPVEPPLLDAPGGTDPSARLTTPPGHRRVRWNGVTFAVPASWHEADPIEAEASYLADLPDGPRFCMVAPRPASAEALWPLAQLASGPTQLETVGFARLLNAGWRAPMATLSRRRVPGPSSAIDLDVRVERTGGNSVLWLLQRAVVRDGRGLVLSCEAQLTCGHRFERRVTKLGESPVCDEEGLRRVCAPILDSLRFLRARPEPHE